MLKYACPDPFSLLEENRTERWVVGYFDEFVFDSKKYTWRK